jgi:hypothetical protein
MDLGQMLGDFLKNSSGHPALQLPDASLHFSKKVISNRNQSYDQYFQRF